MIQRWVASALVEAEPRFRRVRGDRDLRYRVGALDALARRPAQSLTWRRIDDFGAETGSSSLAKFNNERDNPLAPPKLLQTEPALSSPTPTPDARRPTPGCTSDS